MRIKNFAPFVFGVLVSCMAIGAGLVSPSYAAPIKKVVVVGHRGFCSIAPENTMASFKKGIEQKVDMVECDVYKTKDGQLVVMHDSTVDRTTNGKGPIENMTLVDIRKLDAGSKFNRKFAGEKIPTLNELLTLVQKSNSGIVIEIKGWKRIEKEVVNLVHAHNLSNRVVIASFNSTVGPNLKKVDPKLPFMLFTGSDHKLSMVESEKMVESVKAVDGSILGVSYNCISPELIEATHKAGLKLNAWTVNNAADMIALKNMGVDIITTNQDALLMDVVAGKVK